MKLPRATAAQSPIYIKDHPYFISPPGAREVGMILNVLYRYITPPEDADEYWAPSLEEEASREFLRSDDGMPFLLYASLKRDYPRITIKRCFQLIDFVTDDDKGEIFRVVLTRDKPVEEMIDLSHWKKPKDKKKSDGEGKSIHLINFGKLFECERLVNFSPTEIGTWSIDQIENKIQGGNDDIEDIQRSGAPLTQEEGANYMMNLHNPKVMSEIAIRRGVSPDEMVERAKAQGFDPPPWVAYYRANEAALRAEFGVEAPVNVPVHEGRIS